MLAKNGSFGDSLHGPPKTHRYCHDCIVLAAVFPSVKKLGPRPWVIDDYALKLHHFTLKHSDTDPRRGCAKKQRLRDDVALKLKDVEFLSLVCCEYAVSCAIADALAIWGLPEHLVYVTCFLAHVALAHKYDGSLGKLGADARDM